MMNTRSKHVFSTTISVNFQIKSCRDHLKRTCLDDVLELEHKVLLSVARSSPEEGFSLCMGWKKYLLTERKLFTFAVFDKIDLQRF